MKNFELTQSSLKDFIILDRSEWKAKWIDKTRPFEYNTSFIYGSLLDGFLFEPDKLKDKFASYRGKCKPSDGLQAIVGLMSKTYDKSKPVKDQLLVAAKTLKYGGKWKDDTILSRFDDLDDYIKFCIENKRKTVVLKEFANMIQGIANYLVNHYDSDIYKYIVAEPNEDYHNKFQQTIRGTIEGLPCKIILDILHYDDMNNIVQDVDFKTTYDVNTFKESINKYGYDTQLSFYQTILEQNPQAYKNYTLIDPLNIVVGKKDLEIYIHKYSKDELDYSKYGGKAKKGWLEVVGVISAYLKKL